MKKFLTLILLAVLCMPLSVEAKKEKKEKKHETLQEMIAKIEWNSPARTGTDKDLDAMYDHADAFYTLIEHLADSVPLYEIRRVLNEKTGDTILAPVSVTDGTLRSSTDAFNQSLNAVNYCLSVVNHTLELTTDLTANAVQIGIDATPLGNKDRKKANKQIAGFVKIFPVIVKGIKEQSRLMAAYKKQNESLTQDDGPVTSLPGEDISSDVVMTMSDEDIAAWLEAERASRS